MNKKLDKLKSFNKRKGLLNKAKMVSKLINSRIAETEIEEIPVDDPSIEKEVEVEAVPTFGEPIEESFYQTISSSWSNEEKQEFIKESEADNNFMKNMMANYQGRSLLKCINSGKLLSKNAFSVNVTLPARDFRNAVSLDWSTEHKKRFK